MWRQKFVVAVIIGSLIGVLAIVVCRETERRYATLAITGCAGRSVCSPLGVPQECNGARRLCRDSRPLIGWRPFCDSPLLALVRLGANLPRHGSQRGRQIHGALRVDP